MGDLGGGDDDDFVPFLFGIADEVLDVAVLNRRGLVPALDLDQAGLLNRLLIVTQTGLGVLQDIVRELLMQLRRALFHRFLHVQHKGVFLILHFDQPQGLSRRDLVLRDDGGDVVPVETDAVRQDQPVRHVLMGRVRGPGMARRRKIVLLLQVEAGQDLHDPGDLFRL